MTPEKLKRLRAAGWHAGTPREFLKMTGEDTRAILEESERKMTMTALTLRLPSRHMKPSKRELAKRDGNI